MSTYVQSMDLIQGVLAGRQQSIARLISRAESGEAQSRNAIDELYKHTGNCHVVGITGVPGGGKSTLTGVLALKLNRMGYKVAIIAIDPSSPYSGGSIMGDRIRMSEITAKDSIFIRSMATRGAVGGVARSTLDAVDVLDSAGHDFVLIETVGVGQDEVEIANTAHTTIVVSAPGLGDEVQAIKAGILEIADIHVVSKADRSDAKRTVADLTSMLAMSMGSANSWRPKVIPVSSVKEAGFDELISVILEHKSYLFDPDRNRIRALRVAEYRVLKIAEEMLCNNFRKWSEGSLGSVPDRLVAHELAPYGAAAFILKIHEKSFIKPTQDGVPSEHRA